MHVYWVDERAVPPTHERSNYGQAKKALLDPAQIPESNIHRMRGEASDLGIAATDYEAELRETVKSKLGGLPSLDLLVMGIGDDGHTASLFPGERTMHVTDIEFSRHLGCDCSVSITSAPSSSCRQSP